MASDMSIRSISQLLEDFSASITTEKVTIEEIMEAFHERGFGFFLLIFAFPAALPIPALGINTLIATPLFFLTVQQMMGRHVIWLPGFMRRKEVSREFIQNTMAKAIPWCQRVEHLFRPRMGMITQRPFSQFIGLFGLIMAVSITIPLPMTNTVPAFGIAVMAAGTLMRDGLAVLFGATAGLIYVALLVGVTIFLGVEGIDLLKEAIKGWIGA